MRYRSIASFVSVASLAMFKKVCEKLRVLILSILSAFKFGDNTSQIENGLSECNLVLRQIRSALKKATELNRKKHLTSCIAQIKSYKSQLLKLKKRSGGSLCSDHQVEDFIEWRDMESAFKSRIRTAVITNLKHKDPRRFLTDCNRLVSQKILSLIANENGSLKLNISFCGLFIRKEGTPDEEQDIKYMSSPNVTIYGNDNISEKFKELEGVILKKLDDFQESKSGWSLKSIINLEVAINKVSYRIEGSTYIPLPKEIAAKKACVNVKNADLGCFGWALMSYLYKVDNNSDRVSSYPHYNSVLNLDGIEFPMTVNQIPKFEKQNDVSVNVFTLVKKSNKFEVFPCYVTKNKKDRHANLLLIESNYNPKGDEKVTYHYVWIKNLSRLLSSQVNKHDGQKHFCDRCLNYFQEKRLLDKHLEDCSDVNECKIKLPTKENNILKFKNYKYREVVKFIIYADLEAILIPSDNTYEYQEHKPCSIGYYVHCSYDKTLCFYNAYRGEDCIDWFIKELAQFAEDIETAYLCPLPMSLTPSERASMYNSKECWICGEPFKISDTKHIDHCHFTGKIRGVAHARCNINYKDVHVIPVVFHNMSGYDAHFIIKDIASKLSGRIDLLPINKEKYISFTKHLDDSLIQFRFIDSFRFLSSSLADLASNLLNFPILKRVICMKNGRVSDEEAYEYAETNECVIDDERLRLVTRKGVYPYDYFDSFDRFGETQLPPIDKFFNKLEKKAASPSDYLHAQTVWEKFSCKNLGDYSDLYLKTDILLLAEVFEQFRESSMRAYDLDPAHYFTLPGYTWDAMLKFTNIELELLTDVDMLMMIERGVRGGLSQCTKRYAEANNKYMKTYDVDKEDSYLAYFDINSQYATVMTFFMPFSNFEWMKEEDIQNLNKETVTNTSDIGYILEADLEYPQSLHDLHRDIPFCPEHRCPSDSKETRLMATLHDKSRYVIHYMALQQALKHGLKLKKIHRVIKFKQAPWMASYINLNNRLRTAATSKFEKDLFKLMNNAVFGKTIENLRKRSDVRIKTKWEGRYGAGGMISDPFFKSATIFDNEDFVIIEMNKKEIFFNKPIYLGMSILDLAKTTIYEFHYDYMKPNFGNNCEVCYGDTDSLIYYIKQQDIYQYIKRDCVTRFDTSDYPNPNLWDIPLVNKKVLGLMKDECTGSILTKFIGLRAKTYSYMIENEPNDGYENQNINIVKKLKGVKKSVVKTEIIFNDYVRCLQNHSGVIIDDSLLCDKDPEKRVNQNLIRSRKHQVHSISMNKVALTPYDEKRYLIPNSFDTLPWGHYSIRHHTPTDNN